MGIRNICKLVHTVIIKRQAQHEKETEEGEAIEGCMCVCACERVGSEEFGGHLMSEI